MVQAISSLPQRQDIRRTAYFFSNGRFQSDHRQGRQLVLHKNTGTKKVTDQDETRGQNAGVEVNEGLIRGTEYERRIQLDAYTKRKKSPTNRGFFLRLFQLRLAECSMLACL